MSLTVRCFFSLFLLLSPSFAFSQTDSSSNRDLNNDGVYDSRDRAILWWITSKDRAVEFQTGIKSFTAHPSRVNFGQSSTLRWNVRGNPASISIDQGIGDVTNLQSIVVKPQVTTTYTLTAENARDSVTEQVTVYVKPKIVSFTSSPRTITSGEESTLQWNIEGELTEVSIDQGVGIVTGNSVIVSPVKTTTYTLTAVSSGGSTSRQITIFVKPKIISFTADPDVVAPDGKSTLSWEIAGEPAEVSINQGVGDVTGLTKTDIFPSASTTYTITAANQYGSATKTVRVGVKDIPIITSFTANTTVLTSGEQTILRWRVAGGDTLSLETKTVTTTSTATVTGVNKRVRPRETTTYTLTATNSSGSATAVVKVYILRIKSFTANPSVIASGGSSELQWEIEGEPTEVSINQGVGGVTGLNSVSVSPEEVTTYTLTARKTEGVRSRTLMKRVTVRIGNLPVIESFEANSTILTSGEAVVLNWRVTNSNSLSMTRETDSSTVTQTVTGRNVRYLPRAKTTYTLTATNDVGSVTATVQIYFFDITSFTAIPSSIEENSSSTLAWEIEGEPTEVSIDHDVGSDLNASGSRSVSPETTTTYTLTATKTEGSVTKTIRKRVSVRVKTPPIIESFTANKTLLVANSPEAILLRWNIIGDDPISVSLSKTVGSTTTSLFSSLPVNSSHSQSPIATTIYTLTASNSVGTVTATVKVYVLNVKEFRAVPLSVITGGKSTLSWEIEGEPDSVLITNDQNRDALNVKDSSSTVVTPMETTVYTLTAEKTDKLGVKRVTKEVTVIVIDLPVINSFTVSPPVVSCPELPCTVNVTLNWNVGEADTLSINKGIGPVTDQRLLEAGNITTSSPPQATTTYTLTATNSSGSITRDVTVSVLQVKSFTASPAVIISEHSVLRWDVGGSPSSISIRNNRDTNVLDVTGASSIIVTPKETTEYTLTVTETENSIEETITKVVTVYVLKIESFTANPESITEGDSSLLSWDVEGEPTEVSINRDVGDDLDASGNRSVTPEATTTYTLTAKKVDGSRTRTVQKSVKVTVTPPSSGFLGDNKLQDCEGCPSLLALPTALLGQDSTVAVEDVMDDSSLSAVGIQKVTWEQWQVCVNEGGCTDYDFPETSLDHPAVGIQLRDVAIYVDWLSSRTGKQYRLLEDQEWRSMMDHIVSGNAPEDIDLNSFVTDDDSMLELSFELLAPSTDLVFDLGFRVVRNIDFIDEE